MEFTSTALNILLLLAYAIPGFLFVKCKQLTSAQITPISKILLYICQPCLEIYAFCSADCTEKLLAEMGWFFLLCTAVQILVILLISLTLRKQKNAVGKRICTVAGTFGNAGFFGIPLLQALMPEAYVADAVALSAVFAVSMNWLAWTVGLYMISGDVRRIRVKSLLLNPATLALLVALPLFLTRTQLPSAIDTAVSLCGKMATPLCMIALGMRLASTSFRSIFTDKYAFLSCIGKLLVLPLLSFAITYFLPLPAYLKATLFLLCCCPCASAVQNLSEVYLTDKEGKETAANSILLSTLLCLLTIPFLALLIRI